MPLLLHKTLIFLCLTVLTQPQKLTLNEYDQSESNTKCTQGLLQDKDSVILKGRVNMERASTDYSRVVEAAIRRSWLSDNQFHQLCSLQTGHTCYNREEGYPCYCDYVDESKTSHLSIKIKARTIVSQAEIRLQVSHLNGSQIFSETRKLPEIFEKSQSIQINELVPDSESCFLKLNTSDDVINSCCHNLPQPCVSTITRNGLKVVSGDVCASYQQRDFSAWASIYKFTVSVCGDEHYVEPVTCIAENVAAQLSQDTDDSVTINCQHSADIFKLTVFILVLHLLTVTCLILMFYYRRSYGRKNTHLKGEETPSL